MLTKWTPNFIPTKVFVFGCGGTGSRVVPLLAQFIKSCPWVPNPEITLIDFDNVEEKNLLRQNFIATDVDKNKALVLANRYSRAFGINIGAIIHRVRRQPNTTEENEALRRFGNLASSANQGNNLFIMCVDTPEARREIIDVILSVVGRTPSNLVIDAGNENDFGQVLFHHTFSLATSHKLSDPDFSDPWPVTCDLSAIPLDHQYYDTMVATNTPSCAELDQTMAINCLMAVNILGIVQNIYYVKPMTYNRLNISLQHGAQPEYLSVEYLKRTSIDCENEKSTGNIARVIHYSAVGSELTKVKRDVAAFKSEIIISNQERKAKEDAVKHGPDNTVEVELQKIQDVPQGVAITVGLTGVSSTAPLEVLNHPEVVEPATPEVVDERISVSQEVGSVLFTVNQPDPNTIVDTSLGVALSQTAATAEAGN